MVTVPDESGLSVVREPITQAMGKNSHFFPVYGNTAVFPGIT